MASWGELLPYLEGSRVTCPACGKLTQKPTCVPHESKVWLDFSCQQCGLEFRVSFDLNAFAIAKRTQKKGG